MTEWRADERPAVKAFAEKHIVKLDLMIASEWRGAETRREMRRREYEEDENERDDNIANENVQ